MFLDKGKKKYRNTQFNGNPFCEITSCLKSNAAVSARAWPLRFQSADYRTIGSAEQKGGMISYE